MLGLGNSASKGSLAGSDVTQPQKIVIYESNFSSSADGFGITLDGSVEGNASVGGQDDALKITLGYNTIIHGVPAATNFNVSDVSVPDDQVVQVKFLYYFPSANAGADSMVFEFDGLSGDAITDETQDVWNTYESSIATSGSVNDTVSITISGGSDGGEQDGDLLYVKNIEIYYYG